MLTLSNHPVFTSVLGTALALAVAYAVHTLRKWRWMRFEQYAGIPQPGPPSFVWGHLKLLHGWIQRGDPRRHLNIVLAEVAKDKGHPPVMMLDLRPLDNALLVVCHHEVAEQVSRASARWASSTPKSPTLEGIWPLIGRASILTEEGDRWKRQRKRLSPGFAPAHLLTLLPVVLDKTRFFLGHLDRFAASGEAFCLEDYAVNLTFDIIGDVTMGRDFRAQVPGERDDLLQAFIAISQLYKRRENSGPRLPGANWRTERAKARLAGRIEVLMKDVIREEHARVVAGGGGGGSRSVLALSLQGQELTPELLQQTSDNLRLFLFAGHDTTSILLQWALYELSRSPRQRAALAAELDALFGPDPDPEAVRARLLAPGGPELLGKMPYVSAVIKETLRLYPPAGTARMSPPGTGFQLHLPGGQPQSICPDGLVIWINPSLVQRNPAVWGETADEFVPERWLGGHADGDGGDSDNNDNNDNNTSSTIPAGAWRPFERGPRHCIGQELAIIEVKVILALVARKYDFVKTGLGELELDAAGRPVLDDKGRYYKTKSDLFDVSFFLVLLIMLSHTYTLNKPPRPLSLLIRRETTVYERDFETHRRHHDKSQTQRADVEGRVTERDSNNGNKEGGGGGQQVASFSMFTFFFGITVQPSLHINAAAWY